MRLSIGEGGSLTLYLEDGKEKTFVREGDLYRDLHTGREHIEAVKEKGEKETVEEAETETNDPNKEPENRSRAAYRYRGEDGLLRLFDIRYSSIQDCHTRQSIGGSYTTQREMEKLRRLLDILIMSMIWVLDLYMTKMML